MKKYAFFLIIFIVYSCYSMENEFKIQPITNPDELKEGLLLAGQMYDTIFAKDAILTPEEKAWVDEYRKTKPQKLLAIPNRNDVFVMKNNEIAGFIASHLDEKKPTRVILDSIYLAEKKIPRLNLITLDIGNDVYFKENANLRFLFEDMPNFERTGVPDLETVPIMLGYIATKYPQATKLWAAILKKNESGSKLLKSQGFTLSKYMDALHNADIFQGWKREIKK